MKFGLSSNGERLNQAAKFICNEDLHEFIVADQLAIEEAWISEHGTLIVITRPIGDPPSIYSFAKQQLWRCANI
jgi:hypothetical protein